MARKKNLDKINSAAEKKTGNSVKSRSTNTVQNPTSTTKKDIQEIVDWINKELNNLKENAMLPGVNQIQSLPAHSSIYQKQIAVLDKNGQLFGSSININDVMIKPRKPAKNSIAVFLSFSSTPTLLKFFNL